MKEWARIVALFGMLGLLCLGAGCALAETVNLPANLKVIEEETYCNDGAVRVVTVPNGVTEIRSRAFAYSGLEEISLPRSVTFIAEDAFEGCGTFKAKAPLNSYAYDCCKEHGYIGEVEPTPVEDFTYETINGLYARITGYTGTDTVIEIPEMIDDYTIQRISDSAFRNNKTLEYVYIPDTVTEIGRSAFYGCTALVGVDVGNCVETIGSSAFYGCTSLIGVDFPDTLKKTGSGLFKDCSNLEYFDYPINWEEAGSSTIEGCNKITEMVIPEGVIVVPEYAFRYCNNLKAIKISSTVETIGYDSFAECQGLTEISIPTNVVKIGGFRNCKALADVHLSEGIQIIDKNAFSGCISLRQLDLPEGLNTIEDYAFSGCTYLEYATLPDSVKTLGSEAYLNCENLEIFRYPLSLTTAATAYPYGDIFKGCKKLRHITVPEGVTALPAKIFKGADYLKSVDLPEGLIEIGNSAFDGCTAITELEIPEGLETVGDYVFSGCTYLQSALLPDSVKTLGSEAYLNCENLEIFRYPLSLTTAATAYPYGDIFKGCKKLEHIDVPEGVTALPAKIFRGADYLKSVDLPEGLETVGDYAFSGCTYLQSALLPDSVKTLGTEAYLNCENLTTFSYPVSLTTAATVYPYGDIFKGCIALESITVPEGVTILPAKIFKGSDYLSTVYLPAGLKEIGNDAFNRCTAMVNLDLPDGLEKIGNYSFEGCELLEKLYLGYSVSSIGRDAFSSCPALTIWTEYGAYALQYAKDNEIPYYYLTPDGVNSPSGRLYQGDSYALYGYARASIDLTEITATIWNGDGTEALQTITVNPGTTDYDLSGTVNMCLLFGNLGLGSYRYTLTAKTELTEEVWASNSFSIVPPPLRIYIRGASLPDGLTNVGGDFNITGTVISNYAITQLTISLYTSDGVERFTNTVYPGALTYSLSNLAGGIPIASLPLGEYSVRITAIANGETRILADRSFQPVSLDGEVSEKTVGAVAAFVAVDDNAKLFPGTFVNGALGKMNANDVLIMAINSRNSWVYGMASKLFTENHENLYLVDLYESELASIIADLNPNTVQLENISSTEKLVSDAILDYGTNILDIIEENSSLNPTTKGFLAEDFKELTDKLKKLKDGVKGTKMSIELANNLSSAMCNYANGLEILSMVSDSMNTDNAEFKLAVRRMHAKYKSDSFNVTMNLLES